MAGNALVLITGRKLDKPDNSECKATQPTSFRVLSNSISQPVEWSLMPIPIFIAPIAERRE